MSMEHTETERATLAHKLSLLLPKPVAERLRPLWHWAYYLSIFLLRQKGRIYRDRELKSWVASRPRSNGKRMPAVFRSFREFRRYCQFEEDRRDLVYNWIRSISDCEVLYDIGSANGLEGILTNHLHGSLIVFVEPFSPSIETILKTTVVVKKSGGGGRGFEVVQAACAAEEKYAPLAMHTGPTPGETRNSFSDPSAYGRGGRQDQPIVATQWVKSITLDSLHWVYGLPLPTHVKMDIDGMEELAIVQGAKRLLKERCVHSWCIEINDHDRIPRMQECFARHGYEECAVLEHYPGNPDYCGDHVFVRDDLVEAWRRDAAV